MAATLENSVCLANNMVTMIKKIEGVEIERVLVIVKVITKII